MKFVVDAQLPVQLSKFLQSKGFEAIHTDDLPLRDRTPDSHIRSLSDREEGILITKDSDFMDSYRIQSSPKRLLFVTTGNIRNKDLLSLFERNIDLISEAFQKYTLIELSKENLILHQ